MPRYFRVPVLLICAVLLQACASSSALHVARDQFRHGSTQDALQTLAEADVSTRDRLLLHLDRGLVAQAAGQYEDSVVAFEQAIRLIDELDYLSLRDQSTALLSNDRAIRYSGEYSERLWIHTFQMLNYLLLGQPEGAAVEARRAAALYDEHGDALKQDIFTRALMALSFLSAGQVDSAQVEYRRLRDDFSDIIDTASLALPKRSDSELVLFIASGFIPPKLAGDLAIDINARIAFPYYEERYDRAPRIRVLEGTRVLDSTRVDTPLLDISRTALSQRGKAIASRQALRIATKHGIAEAIEHEDAVAGDIARLLLFLIEQADTRSWETLPAYLSLVRVPLEAGKHSIDLRISDDSYASGAVEHNQSVEVEIKPGQRQYKLIRVGVTNR